MEACFLSLHVSPALLEQHGILLDSEGTVGLSVQEESVG